MHRADIRWTEGHFFDVISAPSLCTEQSISCELDGWKGKRSVFVRVLPAVVSLLCRPSWFLSDQVKLKSASQFSAQVRIHVRLKFLSSGSKSSVTVKTKLQKVKKNLLITAWFWAFGSYHQGCAAWFCLAPLEDCWTLSTGSFQHEENLLYWWATMSLCWSERCCERFGVTHWSGACHSQSTLCCLWNWKRDCCCMEVTLTPPLQQTLLPNHLWGRKNAMTPTQIHP